MPYRILRAVAVLAITGLTVGAVPAPASAGATITTVASTLAAAVPAIVPSAAPGPAPVIVAISAGFAHTCLVTHEGTVWCWGSNTHGQLGDGTTLERHRPVQVTIAGGGNLTGVTAINAGASHTCAVARGGVAWCWGYNADGELGDGTRKERHGAVRVTRADGPVLAGVTAVSAAGWGSLDSLDAGHSCARTTDGAAWCWGFNGDGEIGDGTMVARLRAVRVTRSGGGSLTGVTSVSTGGVHTCASTSNGAAWCWGNNDDGELGDGTTSAHRRAVRVTRAGGANLTGVIQVSAIGSTGIVAFYRSCAVTVDGAAWCWGSNYSGELGDGTTIDRHRAIRVRTADGRGLAGVSAITTGLNHTCAIARGGTAMCWGLNSFGEVGDGRHGYAMGSTVPVEVAGFEGGVRAITAGGAHTCAITNMGAARCWGWNGAGQLGDGTVVDRSAPVDVLGLAVWIASIAAGTSHTCAITSLGAVKCWGSNSHGQLGNGTRTDSLLPVDVAGLPSAVTAVTAGFDSTCALSIDGQVRCWGWNSYGQLGNGSTTDSSLPVAVSGLGPGGATAISGQWTHTCALAAAGVAMCWGSNAYGQLGNGSTTDSSVPMAVSGLGAGVLQIAAGGGHTCGIPSNRRIRCWGWNYISQLGNGSTTNSTVPVAVLGLTGGGLDPIAAGGQHTCGLTSLGAITCWGNNVSGQLGDGKPTFGSPPVDVSGISSGAFGLAGGGYHTCVLTSAGGAKCWGFNQFGELGNGTTRASSIPVQVAGLPSGVAVLSAGDYHTCAVTPMDGGAHCWGQNVSGQLGDGSRLDSQTPVAVDFQVRPIVALRASVAAGTIAQGTVVTFTATVRPLWGGSPPIVRFVLYRQDDGGVWHATATRDVAADATGQGTLRWGFVTAGHRYARAKVLPDANYRASPWSSSVIYTVR